VTTDARSRVFVLSPASCAGQRARLLFSPGACFDLARALRTPTGAPLGQVFSFLSGLYFRGKLEYARTYARPPAGVPGVLVITSGAGLCAPEMPVQLDVLRHWAEIPIDTAEARYARPLLRDAQALESAIRGSRGEVVLLGSVATGKYVDLLQQVFGSRLQFPAEFVGRGDMSRGGLLLRGARDRRELSYVPVIGSVRRGARPPRLAPRPPGARLNRALDREWTSASAEKERLLLEAALADARKRNDQVEIRRLGARLRLLDTRA
jgi:hypothetical protein